MINITFAKARKRIETVFY